MRLARHVARTNKDRNSQTNLVGENVRERDNMDDIGVEGKIILKRVLKKQDWSTEVKTTMNFRVQ
jgi:hypothetical protein